MDSFREARLLLLNALSENTVNDEEFLLLEDINTSKNKELSYHNYDCFELDKPSNDECLVEFRFLKYDVYQLAEAVGLPEEMKFYNGGNVDGMKSLYIYSKCFVYPYQYSDIMPRFRRDRLQLSMILNLVTNFI